MKALPVIWRELRAQARQPFTFWLRVLAVGLLLLGGWWFAASYELTPGQGGFLFSQMHLMMYCALWLLVPLGAADCLSRERREGTLGLLFLTPLRPPHIVIAKGLVHGLRAMTMVIAIVPLLAIPFLLGGVAWQQVALAAWVYGNAICWSLGAALVASALCRRSNRAMALAMVLAIAGFIIFPWIIGALIGMNSQTTWTQGYSQGPYDFFVGLSVVTMAGANFNGLLRMVNMAQLTYAIGAAAVISVALLIVAVIFAANCLRRRWREEPPSLQAQQIERTFCRPVVGIKLLQRWMLRLLERNPIGWLERRQWSGRLITWAWFAIIISIYSLALTEPNFFQRSGGMQGLIGWLLALSMAVTAAGSFRRERESGVLELLLVSPLTVRQIINGRLQGIWGQFLPSILLLLGLWLYFLVILRGTYFSRGSGAAVDIWSFAVLFGVIPVIGLYFSVRCRHYLLALVLTILFAIVLPGALATLGQWLSFLAGFDWHRGWQVAWFFQILIAAYLYVALRRKLERRQFPLEQVLS